MHTYGSPQDKAVMAREEQARKDRLKRSDARRCCKLTMKDFKRDHLVTAKMDMAYEVIHRNKTQLFSSKGRSIAKLQLGQNLKDASSFKDETDENDAKQAAFEKASVRRRGGRGMFMIAKGKTSGHAQALAVKTMQLGFGGLKAATDGSQDATDGPSHGKAPVFEDDEEEEDDGTFTLMAMDAAAQKELKEKDKLGRELAAEFGVKWIAKRGAVAQLEALTTIVDNKYEEAKTARERATRKAKQNDKIVTQEVFYPMLGYGKEENDPTMPAVRSINAYPFRKNIKGGALSWWKRRRRDKDQEQTMSYQDSQRAKDEALHEASPFQQAKAAEDRKNKAETAHKASPLAKLDSTLSKGLNEDSESEDDPLTGKSVEELAAINSATLQESCVAATFAEDLMRQKSKLEYKEALDQGESSREEEKRLMDEKFERDQEKKYLRMQVELVSTLAAFDLETEGWAEKRRMTHMDDIMTTMVPREAHCFTLSLQALDAIKEEIGQGWFAKREKERGVLIAQAVAVVMAEVEAEDRSKGKSGYHVNTWSATRHDRSNWSLHADDYSFHYKRHRNYVAGGTNATTLGSFRIGGPPRGEVLPTRSSLAWTNPSVRPAGVDRILNHTGRVRRVDDWGRALNDDDDGGESRQLRSTDTITEATHTRDAMAVAGMRVADLRRLFVAMDINRDGDARHFNAISTPCRRHFNDI